MTEVIAFIGGGNMARSLIGGLLKQGVSPANLRASEPNQSLREALTQDFGIEVHADNAPAVQYADIWVLSVKPQVAIAVLDALQGIAAQRRPLLISIAAGLNVASLSAALGGHARVVRTMPNTPALIGAGITGLCENAALSGQERGAVERLMSAAGATVWIDDEALMDAVTAVSGSGPAYFFLLIEALAKAGVAQGLPEASARKLATHTAYGACRMAIESSDEASILRQRVTSPAGTTAAAIAAFENGGFSELVATAVAAATLRGRELAKG